MNIKEWWDTIVLRDILGYVFPGAMTLFALTLLAANLQWRTPHELLYVVVNFLNSDMLTEEHWLNWHPWLLIAVLLPLSYAAGYLQSWAIDKVEPRLSLTYLGSLALRSLMDKNNPMVNDYRTTAVEMLAPASKHRFGILDAYLKEANEAQSEEARAQAYELWRLCDYYLLDKAREIHATYLGRYYVLTVLFVNLGLSAAILGVVLLVLCCFSRSASGLAAATVLGIVALLLMARSLDYRRHFVLRTFPIFYAVTAERRASLRRPKAHSAAGEATLAIYGATTAALLCGAIGYWLGRSR